VRNFNGEGDVPVVEPVNSAGDLFLVNGAIELNIDAGRVTWPARDSRLAMSKHRSPTRKYSNSGLLACTDLDLQWMWWLGHPISPTAFGSPTTSSHMTCSCPRDASPTMLPLAILSEISLDNP
jgi:hypothetical protein